MSGLSYPNDEVNQTNASPIEGSQGDFLHPIDESEAFYDPFSDLSLFLSKKIKKEIEETGSTSKWSGKIEANLIAKILPEFKQKFPKYRLGTSALKKVWEKVGYYYEKLQGEKEALQKNGTLNLQFMIRENLKKSILPNHLPPYVVAKQIATKLSECVATLEGKRPELDHLTKLIWAVQKHLLKELSPLQSKSPYDAYDKLDKLIVKAQLEITAQGENLDPALLKKKVLEKLKASFAVQTLVKENRLTSTLSMILANKLYQSSLIACHFSLKERKAIESFICHQIAMGKRNPSLNSDSHCIELIQRILALYTIAGELSNNLPEEVLRFSIRQIQQNPQELPHDMDQALYIFINASMHLMDEDKSSDASAEEAIIEAYKRASALPPLSPAQMEQFELLIWRTIEEQEDLLSRTSPNTLQVLEQELGNVLIDNPKQSFKMIISAALQFFKKTIDVSHDPETLAKKVDIWVSQNDMLIRTIHFDPQTPLLKLLEKQWKTLHFDKTSTDHHTFIHFATEQSLQTYPLLASFEKELKERLWILYKYFWYHVLTEDGESSTYDRFLLWHRTLLRHRHPEWPQEKLEKVLSELSGQLIPLAPTQAAS